MVLDTQFDSLSAEYMPVHCATVACDVAQQHPYGDSTVMWKTDRRGHDERLDFSAFRIGIPPE